MNKILSGAVIFLLAVLLFYGQNMKSFKEQNIVNILTCQQKNDSIRYLKKLVAGSFRISVSCLLDSRLVSLEDSFILKDYLQQNPKIKYVYKLMDSSCPSCNIKQIALLEDYKDMDSIMVLSNISNARELLFFKEEFKPKFPIYRISSENCKMDGLSHKCAWIKLHQFGVSDKLVFDEHSIDFVKDILITK